MSDIFISYARSEKERAKPLAEALEKQGYSVWWDPKIRPGKTFDGVIAESLGKAKCVVVLWSKESVKRDWVKEEASVGKRRKILVPALIDDVDLPLGFGLIQAADLTDWEEGNPHSEFDSMIEAIAAIVGRPPAEEPDKVTREIDAQASSKPPTLYPKPTERKLCALVIGTSKRSPGAINEATGVTEFDFNEDLAMRIERKVQKVAVQRIYSIGYKELPEHISLIDPDFAIVLQCNAHNGRLSGTEVLFSHTSEISSRIARILQRHLVDFLGLRDRGARPVAEHGPGGYLLTYTEVPCIVSNPFYIDNDKDLARAREDLEGLAAVFAGAIDNIPQMIEEENEIGVSP